jgi:hypothetical protein
VENVIVSLAANIREELLTQLDLPLGEIEQRLEETLGWLYVEFLERGVTERDALHVMRKVVADTMFNIALTAKQSNDTVPARAGAEEEAGDLVLD